MRTQGENQGSIGMIMEIDDINEKDWEEEKQNLRELKVPFVIIKGLNRRRAMEVSKIQDMFWRVLYMGNAQEITRQGNIAEDELHRR